MECLGSLEPLAADGHSEPLDAAALDAIFQFDDLSVTGEFLCLDKLSDFEVPPFDEACDSQAFFCQGVLGDYEEEDDDASWDSLAELDTLISGGNGSVDDGESRSESAVSPSSASLLSLDSREDDGESAGSKRTQRSRRASTQQLTHAAGNARGKRKKLHTVSIPVRRVISTFSARIACCPFAECDGNCKLGLYYNMVRSRAPAGDERARVLLWAHYCASCDAYHQVEDHGHYRIYNKWRFTPAGGFRDAEGLKKHIIEHIDEVPISWFGRPECNFGHVE